MTEITEKQQNAIVALVAGKTRAEVAKLVRVSETTIYNWLADANFSKRLGDARRYVYHESLESLKDAAGDAVRNLRNICNDGEASASARVSASVAILSQCYKLVELSEVNETIENLKLEIEIMQGKNYAIIDKTIKNGNSQTW